MSSFSRSFPLSSTSSQFYTRTISRIFCNPRFHGGTFSDFRIWIGKHYMEHIFILLTIMQANLYAHDCHGWFKSWKCFPIANFATFPVFLVCLMLASVIGECTAHGKNFYLRAQHRQCFKYPAWSRPNVNYCLPFYFFLYFMSTTTKWAEIKFFLYQTLLQKAERTKLPVGSPGSHWFHWPLSSFNLFIMVLCEADIDRQ